MLGTVATVEAVARALDELDAATPVVLDPVMVAESGARLLDPDAEGALLAEILPRASVLTPNLPEARALLRRAAADYVAGPGSAEMGVDEHDATKRDEGSDVEAAGLARALLALGPSAVVLTGGHREPAVDLFVDRPARDAPERLVEIPGERHPDGAAHGSGCTHSSVLAAQLALGRDPLQAAFTARALAGAAVANGLRDVGVGPGPVDVIGLARVRDS
jgi:hydroxymethylpyrimidine/phosphomethylpyrimidine kinase